jgi:hypothetical protein
MMALRWCAVLFDPMAPVQHKAPCKWQRWLASGRNPYRRT